MQALGTELIAKNNIQPLKLIYDHNIVQKSIAYIFIDSNCNGMVYKDAQKKGIEASKIFNEVLQFREVCTFMNLTREKIVKLLKKLKERSERFAKKI